ncbi:MAG: ATP-dependent Clp protease proteolytic subunit [Thermoleophilaceae bacterium]
MDRDRFLSPEQGVEYGLIDRVIDRRELRRLPSSFTASGG